MPYAAINREGLVLGVGSNPDSACHDANGLTRDRIYRVIPCHQDVVSYFNSGNDVLVRVHNGVAYI